MPAGEMRRTVREAVESHSPPGALAARATEEDKHENLRISPNTWTAFYGIGTVKCADRCRSRRVRPGDAR